MERSSKHFTFNLNQTRTHRIPSRWDFENCFVFFKNFFWPNFQVVAILATWANFGSTAWKAILRNSVHQHLVLLPLQIYRVRVASSLTIWTKWEFGLPSGFEPATPFTGAEYSNHLATVTLWMFCLNCSCIGYLVYCEINHLFEIKWLFFNSFLYLCPHIDGAV